MKWRTTIEKSDAEEAITEEAKYEASVRVEKVGQYLADLKEHEDDLTNRQHQFVRESRERFARYGAKTLFSDKQFHWLKGLWEEHCDGVLKESDDIGF